MFKWFIWYLIDFLEEDDDPRTVHREFLPDDKNSMLFWWPKIKDLNIPKPQTVIIETGGTKSFIDCVNSPSKFPRILLNRIKKAAHDIGYPIFLRTDQLSGKYGGIMQQSWPPLIGFEEDLLSHITMLIEESAMAGILGLPIRAFIVREFLKLETGFIAFSGMPIARERRYFINNGQVLCHHPYWPEEAIEFLRGSGKPPANWQQKLKDLNKESDDEICLLTSYARRVGMVLDGYWSVDFAHAESGTWYLIDMAVGYDSWHPECDFKKELLEK